MTVNTSDMVWPVGRQKKSILPGIWHIRTRPLRVWASSINARTPLESWVAMELGWAGVGAPPFASSWL